MGQVHLSNIEIGKPIETEFKGEKDLELLVAFETDTESEFHYATDDENPDDLSTNRYRVSVILDEGLNVVDFQFI